MPWGAPRCWSPPGHLALVEGHRALAAEGGSLGGRTSGWEWAGCCTVRNWAGLVMLGSVVWCGGVVGGVVGNWPLGNRCCLLWSCCVVGGMASIMVTSPVMLCVMFPVVFTMLPMVAMVAMVACAIRGCKSSTNK